MDFHARYAGTAWTCKDFWTQLGQDFIHLIAAHRILSIQWRSQYGN
jgi:hypothetical protein